eukprot:scaffold3945_cov16-Tisochrysis_lutea.AAC.2
MIRATACRALTSIEIGSGSAWAQPALPGPGWSCPSGNPRDLVAEEVKNLCKHAQDIKVTLAKGIQAQKFQIICVSFEFSGQPGNLGGGAWTHGASQDTAYMLNKRRMQMRM